MEALVLVETPRGRMTRRMWEIVSEYEASRQQEDEPSDSGILGAQAEHLGVDVDLSTGWLAMDGEAL